MPHVLTIATPELGDRSYLLHDGSSAIVVDPQRDLDRLVAAADAAGVRITHVAETHLHNDYVSGGFQLARDQGAEYLVFAGEDLAYDRRPVAGGDRLQIGSMALAVIATPGHTPGHLAYVVGGGGGEGQVVCTGGSMLFGTVGRTDLCGEERADELSRAQHRSVRHLAGELDPSTAVLPTHGFGSFCSSSPPSGVETTTIGAERRDNLALVVEDEDLFVTTLLSGLTRYPAYYTEMAPINRAGPAPFPVAPVERLRPSDLAAHLRRGGWVVDLRARREFAAAHLAGSAGFEHAQTFTTYLGWIVPADARLVLIADAAALLEAARRDLARIGRDGPFGGLVGTPGELAAAAGLELAGYPVTDFAGLAADLAAGAQPLLVLDVRRADEYATSHVRGARNIFVADLPSALGSLPGVRIYAHCASGYRAGVAASLLQRGGHDAVLVDDTWANALESGLPIEP